MIALAALLTSCNKEGRGVDGRFIRISAGFSDVTPTRALLESSDIDLSGMQLTVYGFAGTDVISGEGGAAMSPETATCDGAGNWNLTGKYKWVGGEDHLFFGWLSKDVKSGLTASGFFTEGFNYADKVLTISPKTLAFANADANLDFAYSDVVKRDISGADYSTVNLPLNHLFTSFAVSAHNYTSDNIVIKSVKFYGINNTKGAKITFGETATVEYTDAACSLAVTNGSYKYTDIISSAVTLAADATKANIAFGASDTPKYLLMWPQTSDELLSSLPDGGDRPAAGEGAFVEVVYAQGGGEDLTVYAVIPHSDEEGWDAGTRHNIELSFRNKSLSLTVSAMPWNQTTPVIDYEGAVMVNTGMEIDASSCVLDKDNHIAYFKGDNPIILTFQINQPLNATWLISKDGDFDAFEIDDITDDTGLGIPGDGKDVPQGIVNSKVAKVAISSKVVNPQKDYKMQLSFAVRGNSGVVTNVDKDVQGADEDDWYTFVINK